MSVRSRLFLLVGAAIAATVALVTWTISTAARRAFQTLDGERTAALVAQFRRDFAREGEDVARLVARVASSEGARRVALDLASRHDPASLVNEAAPLAAAYGLDVLDIVASDGTIVSSAEWPARFGYRHPWALDHQTYPTFPNARGGPPPLASLAPSRSLEPQALAAHPAFLQAVEFPEEIILGLVAVRSVPAAEPPVFIAGGKRLDQQFLRSLVVPAGMRALLYREPEPHGSAEQLVDTSGHVVPAAPVLPLVRRVRASGQEAAETVIWPDGPEACDAMPLKGRDASMLGVLLVGRSGRDSAALVSRIRWMGVWLGGLGVLAGLAMSYALAARVTRPVEQLAAVARAVAGGDWNARVGEIRAPGELAALAEAFDTMTRQLVDHRDRLVQAERVAAWRELARRLAHELKNPLFPLRLTVDNLRQARALPPHEFEEVLDESLAAFGTGLTNLNAVVGQFSDFARMPPPRFEQVSPNDIVRSTITLFHAQINTPERPPLATTLDLDPAVTSIQADPEQLGRALQNLVLNAIDAMPDGGTLTIRTTRAEDAVHLDVCDTGQGLSEDEQKRLFTPYYTTKRHGTGLGLAIVQSVVADHDGRISVESQPGRGARFHIELPVDGPSRAEHRA